MNNTKSVFRRIGAYLIDTTIIILISSLITGIPGLNKESKQYQETYIEYQEKYEEYDDTLEFLEEIYEEKEFSDEDYNEIENSAYKDLIIDKIEDKELTKKEYQEAIQQVNKAFDVIAKDYVYLLKKNNKTNTIVTLICTILYFGILQYLLKGQTIGKRLLNIQVVSATDKKLNIFTYILRSLIVNEVLFKTIGIIFLIFSSKNIYTNVDSILGTIISIVEAIIIFTVMTRPDERGIHDLLFGTKVISTINNKKAESKDIIEIKEEKTTLKKKNPTKKKPNKKTVDAKYKEKSTK